MVRRFATASVVAWMVMAGVFLGKFADEALPTAYLVRPLLLASIAAPMIGLVCTLVGRHAALIAAFAALLLVVAKPWVPLALLGVFITLELIRRRQGARVATERGTFNFVLVFFAIAVFRTIPILDLSVDAAAIPNPTDGPPTYLILLDGHARADTLAQLGSDQTGFIEALEARGFDYYPSATSLHGWTHKTLLAMLTGEVVADGPSSSPEKREIRARLAVPEGFVAISPAIGHVVLSSGPRIDVGGINDYEAYLLAQSAAGVLFSDWAWTLAIDSLRDQIDRQLAVVAETDHRRVFAHILSPHPPFLYGDGGVAAATRSCWPDCNIFDTAIQNLGITTDEWGQAMGAQVEGLHARLLTTIDRVLASHPDAVIVLFSDHGGRYTYEDLDEWHRSFLIARTPGHPLLFRDEPRPDQLLRILQATYYPPNP